MTRNPLLLLSLAALGVVSAGAAAADRWTVLRAARADREEAGRMLEKAAAIAREHPQCFGPLDAAPAEPDGSLKGLAQELSTARHVTLGYLSENDRDGEKGRRERQVILRAVNASHPNLVLFLQDLETRGGGARVKEIHVRPSREIPDTYEEVEVVVSRTAPSPQERKP